MARRSPGQGRDNATGSYLLLLDLAQPRMLRVGALGEIRFEAGVHLYAGSAFGSGGLAARLGHHLRPAARPHWHVDHLRRAARLVGIWVTHDPRRMECAFFEAAMRLRGARSVPRFGASDCDCPSHLVAVPRLPLRATFRRHLRRLTKGCDRIQTLY